MLKKYIFNVINIVLLPIVILLVFILPKKRKELLWGPVPIINNKYWSQAMREKGFISKTIMGSVYGINKKMDYDIYYDDFVKGKKLPAICKKILRPYLVLFYMICNAAIVHLPFSGGPLGNTNIWRIEAYLFRWAGIKTVILSYGADAYLYSQIIDPVLRNVLLNSYPAAARAERKISRWTEYWAYHADCILRGFMLDGAGRWDVALPSALAIDVQSWKSKLEYSNHDGHNGPVKIIHTPNHRGFKGTEYLIEAITQLKTEGLKVELVLLEGVPNDEVKRLMQEVDILAEQFIFTGYALSALEGMASGLPVISNLEHEAYTRIFRRYSYLNECPILSTTPENLKENLKILITNPELRKELGQAGRKYVEKYHSYETAQYLFGAIYEKILHDSDIDLMNLFHPLLSKFNKRQSLIRHPLFENRLSAEYLANIKKGLNRCEDI